MTVEEKLRALYELQTVNTKIDSLRILAGELPQGVKDMGDEIEGYYHIGERAKSMEKSNTREEILEAALDLFAVNGYEATSISQLADAVGIRKASLYSHFANKQDILDTVVETVLKGYADHSIFVRADWDDPEFTKDKTGMTAEDVAQLIQGQMRYILHDPHIQKGRKMLMIEQFRNAELAELQTKQNYENVLNYFMGMMRFLITIIMMQVYYCYA